MSDWPAVGVVIGAHRDGRIAQRAITAVRAQRHPGRWSVVAYDRAPPDLSLTTDADRPVWLMENTRAASASETHHHDIRALDTAVVALRRDDDLRLAGKLAAQASATQPESEMAIRPGDIPHPNRRIPRLTGVTPIRQAELPRWRITRPRPSTFLMRRDALLGGLGMIVKDAPISHIDHPYVGRNDSQLRPRCDTHPSWRWLPRRHLESRHSRARSVRRYGQLSCWHAAMGDRIAGPRWRGGPAGPRGKNPGAP